MIINPFRTRQGGLGDGASPTSMPQEQNGVEAKPMAVFTQRLNNMPDALKVAIANQKAEVYDRIIYAVHTNDAGSQLTLIGDSIEKIDGICNFDKGKMPSNEFFFFEKFRLLGKLFTITSPATSVTVADVVKSTFDEVSALVKNSFLTIKIGSKTMVDSLPLSVLSTTTQESGAGIPIGSYRFGTGFLVSPNEILDIAVKLPATFNMDNKTYALRLELHGVGAKILS